MLTSIITNKTPAGAAKLTLEGLLHWKTRLTGEVARLVSDIEAQEAMAERWCGKCAESLEELKALHTSKQSDLAKVDDAIAAIQHDLEVASAVATIHETAPLLLVPRQTGHPSTGCLIQSARLLSPRLDTVHSFPNTPSMYLRSRCTFLYSQWRR